MRPGRELDTLIAERITKTGHEGAPEPLLYSTCIADAMLVAEQFECYALGVTTVAESAPVVPFAKVWFLGEWFTAYGETPQHSLCLATLKARAVPTRLLTLY